MPEVIKTIKKTYKDYAKYIEYDIVWFPSKGTKRKRKKTDKDKKTERSIIRARTAIFDIIACNKFEFFVTLTVSPRAKFDRYNYDECTKNLSKWLQYHLKHYILVPEKHKDGAFHFHLLADIPKEKLKYHGYGNYALKSYKFGIGTASRIRNEQAVSVYITKYITKELSSTVGKNRRMYWCSKDLKRPTVEYNKPIPKHHHTIYENQQLKVHLALE